MIGCVPSWDVAAIRPSSWRIAQGPIRRSPPGCVLALLRRKGRGLLLGPSSRT